MTREKCLSLARDAVMSARESEYGSPKDSMDRIARMWSAAFGHEFSARDVALAMVLVKASRISSGHGGDSWVDAAGYSAIGFEIDDGQV